MAKNNSAIKVQFIVSQISEKQTETLNVFPAR